MKFFISHSSKDDKVIDKIQEAIRIYHLSDPWIDHQGQIKDGISPDEEIKKGLNECTHFLLVWSKNAAKDASDGYNGVKKEIALLKRGKLRKKYQDKICILKLDKQKLPRELEKDYLYHNTTEQTINKTVETIIRTFRGPIETQFKKLQIQITEDYKNSNPNPIIKNFKKFNGYIQSSSLRYWYIKNKTPQKGILGHTLKLIESGQKFIPVVSDYGGGKSTFCHNLLYMLCGKTEHPFLIFVPLGDLPNRDVLYSQLKNRDYSDSFIGGLNSFKRNNLHDEDTDRIPYPITFNGFVEDLLEFITKEYGFIISKDEFSDLIKKGKVTFILDALDEMTLKIDSAIPSNNIHNIKQLTEQNNTVILTSRHTYLPSAVEKELVEQDDLIEILSFEMPEIKKHIKKIFKNNPKKASSIIQTIKNSETLSTLVQKPLLLNLFCDTSESKQANIINGAHLLQIKSIGWLSHDIDQHNENCRDEILNERLTISEILALIEHKIHRAVSPGDMHAKIDEEFKDKNLDTSQNIENFYRIARDSTFLTKATGDTYKFILKPFKEYFLARRFVNNLQDKNCETIIDEIDIELTDATFEFVKEIISMEWLMSTKQLKGTYLENPNSENLQKIEDRSPKILECIEYSRNRNVKNSHNMTNIGNLVRILIESNKLPSNCDLSKINLENLKIQNANLEGTNFSDTVLKNLIIIDSNLQEVNFNNTDMRKSLISNNTLINNDFSCADLSNSEFSDVTIRYPKFTSVRLDNAKFKVILDSGKFDNASLLNTNLNKAILHNVDFDNIPLGGITVDGTSFVNCINMSISNKELERKGAVSNNFQ